ncbi:ACT domain-containing protein [Mobilitalea sibirica]|uniref:ACT domain-containing protein n=1 Tax=Mobilitalea sibirica TaxID=1462919 RepID=A0A8J7KUZ2_9FIRM|nr:ACT domain-containing protein [Mobilitalea sibirica]MBH1939550.1 ACT domain-containing protein [Mobilitalea sibirica]
MIKQLSVFVQNEIGSLAGVTSVLKDNNINLRAIASFDTPEFAILRIVVDQPEKAKSLLSEHGFAVKMSEAVAVELIDKPGALDGMLHVIADAGLGVNYIYSIVVREGKVPLMIINTEDLPKTAAVLREKGYTVAEQEDIKS